MNPFTWKAPFPISFHLDGRPSQEFLSDWKTTRITAPADGGRLTVWTLTHPSTGLRLRLPVRTFDSFDATDWLMELENTGSAESPILEKILPVEWQSIVPASENAYLHYAKGSSCTVDDFLPITEPITPWRCSRVLAPVGGRSSNGILPFFNLFHRDGGVIIAVGWSGQWEARFERDGQALRISAGMQDSHLRLRPGEKIRTPRILILNYRDADPQEGNNALRRLLLAHYLPRVGNELFQPPVATCLHAWYYLKGDMHERTELKALERAAELGITAYWIDACWYGQGRDWWQEVGNWTVNRKRYPRGLRPIADAAHQKALKFVLWFEPARVRADSDLARQHPDYVLRDPANPDNALLDFGNPTARQYMLDLISEIIEESSVDIYREDFNFDPLPYWCAADAADRRGIAEARYITGHYAFWDELRRRFPHLAIDNCASGGRRIDLETLSRSLPLWPSDFTDVGGLQHGQGLHIGSQCIKAGLARWAVLMGGGAWSFSSPYGTRSALLGGFTFGMHIAEEDFLADHDVRALQWKDVLGKCTLVSSPRFPARQAKAAIAEWKSLHEFFLGDFYLLMPLTVSPHDWCAFQFHKPDPDAGFALFLRRHQSPFSSMQANLRRIEPRARYQVTLATTYKPSPPKTLTGKELAALTVSIDKKPGSLLLRYCKSERGRK